jgi:hypothetical protein
MTAPTNGLIADFMGDGGIETAGRIDPYPSTGGPTVTTTGGSLHLTLTQAPVASPPNQYSNGVSLSFTSCIDASAFTGTQFSITGTISGCSIAYANVDSAHQQMSNNALGTAATGDYAQTTTVTVPSTNLMVPFPTTGAGAMPAQALNKMQLIQLNWGIVIPPPTDGGAAANCMVDVMISNVKFY